ncbi:MAG TPA: hypothetical protein VFW22_15890 [Pseudolabrys sp.]|nr:hypothetical protein [Pseudolabrys sp.]
MPRPALCLAAIALAAALTAVPAQAQGVPAGVLSDYQARLAEYLQARQAYDAEAEAYWNAVSEKRRLRNAKRRDRQPIELADYVLNQPPLYSGPRRPIDPQAPGAPPSERAPIPVVADFLLAAAEQYNFVPQQPASDLDFKRAYAGTARAAGLTREQIVGVYAFETGGHGAYNTQAGLEPPGPGKRAISPALGYNQLLSTNSVSILAEHGPRVLAALRQKAKGLSGSDKAAMERKIEALKRMIAFSRSVPNRWSEHDRLAKTTMGGLGIHAAILDVDIGPLLQVQKLLDSVLFARAKGYAAPLSAAELELMNLTGDGNGFDMVTMPPAFRQQVPTANFFQRQGYERNPVARRTKVVAGLIAEIQGHINRNSATPGARDLAAAF